LIKWSKDSDSSLFSNANLSKIFPSSSRAFGQVTKPKWPKTCFTYDVTHRLETQNQNFFSLQTQRLTKSFKGLNSSLVQSAKKLCGW